MSDGWDCRRLHHHDTRAEADACDATPDEPTDEIEMSDPPASEDEWRAGMAEARRRIAEARGK